MNVTLKALRRFTVIPFTSQAPTSAKKKPAARRAKRRNKTDRLAQLVTIIAVGMAAGYVVLRVIGWLRFI